jgi:hypothetical protein
MFLSIVGGWRNFRRVSAYMKPFSTRNEISWKEILALVADERVSQFKDVLNLGLYSF